MIHSVYHLFKDLVYKNLMFRTSFYVSFYQYITRPSYFVYCLQLTYYVFHIFNMLVYTVLKKCSLPRFQIRVCASSSPLHPRYLFLSFDKQFVSIGKTVPTAEYQSGKYLTNSFKKVAKPAV